MRTIELYRKHKAGEVSREKFLYEVRRDKNLPWITNITSFDDAVKILKNKGVISEAEISENYEVHYSNQNVKAAKKFNNKQQAIKFAQELANKGAKEVVVFNAGPNFNSTADTDAVVAWSGDGSFMDNKSKNDPKLAAKKMSLGETGVDEATIKDLFGPLSAKLESMGYSVDIDSTGGYKTIFAYKVLPDKSSLTVFVGPSETELKTRDYKGFDNFETIDMSVKYYTDQITKKFFGLFKNKERVMQKLSDDTEGENIDLGRGMFEIPIDQSVVKVTDIVKKAEQKVAQMNSSSLNEIDEISAQTKYNAAMKAVDRGWSSRDSDSKYKKAISQGNKFIEEIDPVLKKTVEDFGKSLGFETKIEKGTTGFQFEPIVKITMGKDLKTPEIKVVITKDSDKIEGSLPDEVTERRLANLIKQIQKKELDVELGSGSLNEVDNNIPTDPAVDRVNPYFLKRGVQMLLAKEKELTNDSYIKALNKAASMLEKNPHAFDEEMFANAKDVEKADAKLETEEVKKANHKNKANEMKKVKVKSLKESAIEDLTTHLKKKDLVNEDSHWKHHVGSEVHTPDGQGKVIEIVGGTFTVEMEDGTQKDYQINTVDHFTQKSQEQEPTQGAQSEPTVKDMWANWDKNQAKPFGGMVGDPEQFKKPLDLSKIKQYMEMYKDDKKKMKKLKEVLKKLKEAYVIKTVGSNTVVGAGKNDSMGKSQAKGIEQNTGEPLKIVNLKTGQEQNV